MKLHLGGMLGSLALLASTATFSLAATTPVTIDLTGIHAIQKYALDDKADDHAYAVVDGIAAGAEFEQRFPEGTATWETGPKKSVLSEKAPDVLWKGDLKDGEFAFVTVTLFQGEEKDPGAIKGFLDQIIAAEKKAPDYSKKTITADEFKALTGVIVKGNFVPGALIKNEQAVVSKVKDTFSREKKTDHYGGLFNIIVWNDGTSIRKRVVPVGLTFGEQYGNDVKIYTKLKYTRNNVFLKDDSGEWSTDQLAPLSDDEKTIRVKMLETEMIKGADGNPVRKTTDYLADLQVKAGGQTVKWKLGAEVTGVDDIHTYWEYAD